MLRAQRYCCCCCLTGLTVSTRASLTSLLVRQLTITFSRSTVSPHGSCAARFIIIRRHQFPCASFSRFFIANLYSLCYSYASSNPNFVSFRTHRIHCSYNTHILSIANCWMSHCVCVFIADLQPLQQRECLTCCSPHIVKVQWLIDSLKQNSCMPEDNYLSADVTLTTVQTTTDDITPQ